MEEHSDWVTGDGGPIAIIPHCIIDQWFSVISKIILKQNFIATPWAMKALLALSDSLKKYQPPIKSPWSCQSAAMKPVTLLSRILHLCRVYI